MNWNPPEGLTIAPNTAYNAYSQREGVIEQCNFHDEICFYYFPANYKPIDLIQTVAIFHVKRKP
jgi:hypothetical protein